MNNDFHNNDIPKEMIEASFTEFLWIWNRLQNLPTPAIHQQMADWLDQAYEKKDTHLLLQAFRASGKSTLCGLYAAWLLYKKPDCRIMILAAEQHLATKMVRNVKHIIERHPLIGDLKPGHPEQWGACELTVLRRSILRDPSVVAHGITGNFTGSRADVIICDDVEVPNNCNSIKKREDLRLRLSEIDYVLNPAGVQIYIGTPHSYYSIYAKEHRSDSGETAPFLCNFKRLEIPVMNAKGESAWQEKFSNAYIAKLRKKQGPNKFSSQMLLQPLAPKSGMLNPDLLELYDGDLEFHEANDVDILTLKGVRLLSSSCFWDPAFGGNDDSVIACVFTDEKGSYYLHDLLRIKIDEASKIDNARQQCIQVANFLKDNYQLSVHVESNGVGKFLPSLLRQVLEEEKTPASVIEVHHSSNKNMRILQAYDALLAAKQLHVRRFIAENGFMQELREWDISALHNKDDSLDAVAGCIESEPLRLPRQFQQFKKPSWRQNHFAGSLRADSHFDI